MNPPISDKDKKIHTVSIKTEVAVLDSETAFNALTDKERMYCHFLSKASWYGSIICLFQTSAESSGLFVIFNKLFNAETVEKLTDRLKSCNFTQEQIDEFLLFVAAFHSNMGNYKSFGDTKIVPSSPRALLDAVFTASPVANEIAPLWKMIGDRVCSLTPRDRILGMGPKAVNTYFSSNCDEVDGKIVEEFLSTKNISAYNTRCFKKIDKNNIDYNIMIASSDTTGKDDKTALPCMGLHRDVKGLKLCKQGATYNFNVTRGDHAFYMQRMVDNLQMAMKYTSNDKETAMLKHYIASFTYGSIDEHKEGSRHWIRNTSPSVETYIGFIESYRDPMGTRGEFEGFVAMVNKEQSRKFQQLVCHSEHLLSMLPWPASYEKDVFLKPDFTSLDVLSFASSGIPAGINIPNYDDIRQSEGFKNVSLGNVLSAGYKDSKVTFLSEEDAEMFKKLKIPSFEVQVGIHELLGHGSGKLFVKNKDGVANFDAAEVKHMKTGLPITSWYKENETWDGKFGKLSSPYEECRAECVGIYLCLSSEVLKIFGHEDNIADDIIYINWLNMVRAGLLALEFYAAETSTWMQAHMQARYVILRVLLEAGEDLVTITHSAGKAMDNSEADLLLSLDRSKINQVGKKAIGEFLGKLQLYKSTADFDSANEMFSRYSNVCPDWLAWRDIVMANTQPRKMFVQPNTDVVNGKAVMKTYDGSSKGIIESWIERYGNDNKLVESMVTQFKNDAANCSI